MTFCSVLLAGCLDEDAIGPKTISRSVGERPHDGGVSARSGTQPSAPAPGDDSTNSAQPTGPTGTDIAEREPDAEVPADSAAPEVVPAEDAGGIEEDGGTPVDASSPIDAGEPTSSGTTVVLTPEVPAQAPTLACVTRVHGPGRNLITDVASARDGRVAIVGILDSAPTVDFGGGPVQGGVAFAAVYSPTCTLLWYRAYGTIGRASTTTGAVSRVKFSPDGSLVVGGSNLDALDFGAGIVRTHGGYDVVIAKYDSAYRLLWAHEYGDANSQTLLSFGLDGGGNIYLAGTFTGNPDFGNGVPLSTTQSNGAGFLAKLDPSGNTLSARTWFGAKAGPYTPKTFDVADDGAMTLTGSTPTGKTIDLGGGPRDASHPYSTSYPWIVRLDANGAHAWSRAFRAFGIRATATLDGDVVMGLGLQGGAPYTELSIDLGNGNVGGRTVLARLRGSDGSAIFSRGFQAAGEIVASSSGGILFAGYFDRIVDFGCGAMGSQGANDLVLARFAGDGSCLYSTRAGDSREQHASSVATDATGRVVYGGSYQGSIRLAKQSLPNDETTGPSAGEIEDGFISIFAP